MVGDGGWFLSGRRREQRETRPRRKRRESQRRKTHLKNFNFSLFICAESIRVYVHLVEEIIN